MQGIVLICDRVESRENVNIFTTNLEFTSKVYFSSLYDAALKLTNNVTVYESPTEFEKNIHNHRNDAVFSAIWSGELSRNRKALLPAICEANEILYIGADAFVQSLAQDKDLSKIHAKQFGMKSASGVRITSKNDFTLLKHLKYPVVVKPNYEGSSIGISDSNLKYTFEETLELVKILLPQYKCILVEEYIGGVEVSICIVGTTQKITTCEVVALEIDGKMDTGERLWGYESKKCSKAVVTRKVITDMVPQNIITTSQTIFKALGKVDYMRIDGKILNDEFYLIEYTPDCSLHPVCFMRKAFEYNNKTYAEMLSEFIDCAKANLS